jgi:hypothetical protein
VNFGTGTFRRSTVDEERFSQRSTVRMDSSNQLLGFTFDRPQSLNLPEPVAADPLAQPIAAAAVPRETECDATRLTDMIAADSEELGQFTTSTLRELSTFACLLVIITG